ncbi:MAG: pyridoxamine 5'-phosphate oxidase family protein, partial [Terriglobia bacterium]
MIEPVYHAGELAVQVRAGASEQAQHIGAIIRSDIPSVAREFLQNQRMVVLSTLDSSSQVWASVLAGPPSFVQVIDSQTVQISAIPVLGDPLAGNLKRRHEIGMFVVEFSTRRRMKVKGQSERVSDGSIVIHAARVYSQCTKYIQARELIADSNRSVEEQKLIHGQSLTPGQQEWIGKADTFFIASFHPETGADASHRGGNPGFVKVVDKETLAFPNYWGNAMFNTLGNITVN